MKHRAFTLIELLLAIGAAAVLMTALLIAFGSSWRLQERGFERDRTEAPRQELRHRLRREFAAAMPPSGLLAGPLIAVSDDSSGWRRDDVEWVAAVGAGNPDVTGADLVKLHYYLIENDAGGVWDLIRTENRNLLAAEEEDPEEVVVATGLLGFEALWYDGTDWQDEWDSTVQENQLPQAVRLRLDFAEVDGRTPPPVEVIVLFVARTLSSEGGAS